MKKIDRAVIKETVYIASWVLVFSMLMQAVFLVLSRWSYTVLLGNLLGGAAATANFFIMGITVQKALGKEEKDAKSLMKLSQSLRLIMMIAVAFVAYIVPCFHLLAAVIPFLFPRLAIAARPLFSKK